MGPKNPEPSGGAGKGVVIPRELLRRTVDLLRYWDLTGYDAVVRLEYEAVLDAFDRKEKDLELRALYARMVAARDEDARHDARIEYLRCRHARDLPS